MNSKSIKRAALPLTFAATAAGGLLAPQHALAASAARKYTGAVAYMSRWGPIKVTITVKNKKITNVKSTVTPDNPRSNMIESQALPILKQEVLRAQSANVQAVSGATDTTYGFITSLQSAIAKAQKARTL